MFKNYDRVYYYYWDEFSGITEKIYGTVTSSDGEKVWALWDNTAQYGAGWMPRNRVFLDKPRHGPCPMNLRYSSPIGEDEVLL